jgi:putative transposase
MVRPKIKPKGWDWKELLPSEKDLIEPALQEIVQKILEAEMDETVGAQKSERTATRTGYRSGYFTLEVDNASGKTGIASAAGSSWTVQHGRSSGI